MRTSELSLSSPGSLGTGATGRNSRRSAARNLVFAAGFVLLLVSGSQLFGADNGIALLVSDHTYAYFTNAYEPTRCSTGDWTLGTHEYERYYLVWKALLDDAGIPYSIIGDAGITPDDLKNFKVLILSNAFWLDDSQTKIIAEWVRKGGHLLATFGSGYAGEGAVFKEGGTNGLHELWGDPSAKLNSSLYLGSPWVKLQVTQNGGPTNGFARGAVLDYQWLANVLVQRPISSRDIYAFFVFDGQTTRRPAVFSNRHSKGRVVYFAFAPEYPVAMATDVAGHCGNDTRYGDAAWLSVMNSIAAPLVSLMKSTLAYVQLP